MLGNVLESFLVVLRAIQSFVTQYPRVVPAKGTRTPDINCIANVFYNDIAYVAEFRIRAHNGDSTREFSNTD